MPYYHFRVKSPAEPVNRSGKQSAGQWQGRGPTVTMTKQNDSKWHAVNVGSEPANYNNNNNSGSR